MIVCRAHVGSTAMPPPQYRAFWNAKLAMLAYWVLGPLAPRVPIHIQSDNSRAKIAALVTIVQEPATRLRAQLVHTVTKDLSPLAHRAN